MHNRGCIPIDVSEDRARLSTPSITAFAKSKISALVGLGFLVMLFNILKGGGGMGKYAERGRENDVAGAEGWKVAGKMGILEGWRMGFGG